MGKAAFVMTFLQMSFMSGVAEGREISISAALCLGLNIQRTSRTQISDWQRGFKQPLMMVQIFFETTPKHSK